MRRKISAYGKILLKDVRTVSPAKIKKESKGFLKKLFRKQEVDEKNRALDSFDSVTIGVIAILAVLLIGLPILIHYVK